MSKPFDPEDFPYTLWHDDLASVVAKLRGSSVKLLYYIMRRSRVDFTHFRRVRITYDEILAESGIRSYTTVRRAIEQLLNFRIVTEHIIGHIPGIDHPLCEYQLNLDYTPESVVVTPESVVVTPESVVTSTPESVVTSTPESVVVTPESVVDDTTKDTKDVRRVSQSRDSPLDHDHEEEDLLHDHERELLVRLQKLGQSRAQAHQLIEKQGVGAAWQWYAFVIDPENKVDNPVAYLYTAAIANSSPPPVDYKTWEIDEIEQARARAEMVTNAAPAEPRTAITVSPNMALWRRVLGDLRQQVTSNAFSRWLANSELVDIDDGVARVQVGDGYAVEWLSTRWKVMILRTLSGIAGEQDTPITDVQFEERKDQ